MRNIPRAHKSIHRAGVWGRATFVLRSFDLISPISQPNRSMPNTSGRGCDTESLRSNVWAECIQRLRGPRLCAILSRYGRAHAPIGRAAEWPFRAVFLRRQKSRNVSEASAKASANSRISLFRDGTDRAVFPAPVVHALAPRLNIPLPHSRAAPCISRRALRCGCRCDQAGALKFSTRSAESAPVSNGIRASDHQKIRKAAGNFIAERQLIYLPIVRP